jgi:protein tyrosine/serine phosphatase
MLSRRRRVVRWFAAIVAGMMLAPLLYVAYDQATCNLGTAEPGRIYRSGQMPAQVLARTLRQHRIKSVLNLRGPNPAEAWYRDELHTTLAAGATQIDIPLSSCLWMSPAQLKTVIETLETAERPLLIHCAWGSERTGLVSALAVLLREGSTLEEARAQFSLAYLFVRRGDGKIMAEHLDQYASWLSAQGLKHDPRALRRWVESGFHPRLPNREQWPYDPYPLSVITRPPWKREVKRNQS